MTDSNNSNSSKNSNSFEENLAFINKLLRKDRTTAKHSQLTDDDLKENDYKEIKIHTQIYSDFMNSYVSEYKMKSKKQRRMKSWFFYTVISMLFLITGGGVVAVILTCLKHDISTQDMITVITAIAGSISSFLILPKVIAENLFPSKEDDQTAELFGKMFEHDMDLRHMYKKDFPKGNNQESIKNEMDNNCSSDHQSDNT